MHARQRQHTYPELSGPHFKQVRAGAQMFEASSRCPSAARKRRKVVGEFVLAYIRPLLAVPEVQNETYHIE
jgi:hypothetical protein